MLLPSPLRRLLARPFILATLVPALLVWPIALVAQAVAHTHTHSGAPTPVSILWPAWITQTFLLLGLLFALSAPDHTALHTYSHTLATFAAVALTLAVIGIDNNLYNRPSPAQRALAAAWIISAAIDVLWVFYFTLPPDSFLFRLIASEHPIEKNGQTKGSAHSLKQLSRANSQDEAKGPHRESGATVVNSEGAIHQKHVDPAVLRAEAMYSYDAQPEDPNEISFNKGDILDVIDKSGNWWHVQKSDGSTGIAPSNYLQLIQLRPPSP